jgi:hypothetical protein
MFQARGKASALKQSDRAPSLMQAEAKGRPVNFSAEKIAAMLVFGAVVLGGMGLVALLVRGRQRMRELAIKERISLIEKGLVPSPEADPAGFESFFGLRRPMNVVASRFQSAGVLIMGLGLALAVLLSFVAGNPAVGVGLGGGLAILGMAAFINGALLAGDNPPGPGPS